MSKPICQVLRAEAMPAPYQSGAIALDIALHDSAEFRFVLTETGTQKLVSDLLVALLAARILTKGGNYAN